MIKYNKLRDTLYQLFYGFKPVKRENKKQGQSEWYYIDPRYDDDKRGQIDVFDENSPNPLINEILANDMDKNPENYYIWQTKGDDKVRDAHAAREGLIFNKHIPPEGGNPGEDYNCRCWAEPYEPEKYKNKQMIVDLGGLDTFKDLRNKLKPVDFSIKGLPQYAANDKSGVATDATSFFRQNISDDELLNLMSSNLLNTEKMKNYIYLDKFGHITSGVGALLDDEKDFKNIPWIIGNRLATESEVNTAYKWFTYKRFEKDDKGNFKNHNRFAESFEKESPLRVSQKYMVQQMMKHLKEDLFRARKKRNDFDTYPLPLKLIILDFYYNKGSFYNQPGLPQALDIRNAKLFQEKMVRHMADRDKWTQKQFDLIPKDFWKNY